jgi:hypothetical protein
MILQSLILKSLRGAAAFLGRHLDRGDVLVLTGIMLVAIAAWGVYRPMAFGLPGAVLIWYGLPTRPRFIDRGSR